MFIFHETMEKHTCRGSLGVFGYPLFPTKSEMKSLQMLQSIKYLSIFYPLMYVNLEHKNLFFDKQSRFSILNENFFMFVAERDVAGTGLTLNN